MRVTYSRTDFTQKRLKNSREVQGPKCMPHFSVTDNQIKPSLSLVDWLASDVYLEESEKFKGKSSGILDSNEMAIEGLKAAKLVETVN